MSNCPCFDRMSATLPRRYDFAVTPLSGEAVYNDLTNGCVEVVCTQCQRRFYVGTWETLNEQRDAARALADQLAASLLEVSKWIEGGLWEPERGSLDAWEARDWRPISPPGSGLDGLLADINREKP